MKKIIALVALSLSAAASVAQSVNLYGILDTGVEYISNVGASGKSVVLQPTLTGSIPSRIGFRGAEDIGGGNKVLFTLESGIQPDTGNLGQGSRIFGRQALVGISGSWGEVTVGRLSTMLFWSVLDSDVLVTNIYGTPSLDNYFANARADNAVGYRGTFNGLSIGATFSLGRDAVNAGPSPAGTNCAGEVAADHLACREFSGMIKYDAPRWGAAAAYDRIYGGTGAFGGLTLSEKKDTRALLNGYAKFGLAKIGAGYIRRKNDGSLTPTSALYYINASYPVMARLVVDAELHRLAYRDSANRATLAALRATYSLSKRTSLYLTAGHIANDGTLAVSVSSGSPGTAPSAGASQNGVMAGLRHTF